MSSTMTSGAVHVRAVFPWHKEELSLVEAHICKKHAILSGWKLAEKGLQWFMAETIATWLPQSTIYSKENKLFYIYR